MSQQSTLTIDKFLGLRQDYSNGLNIAVGELSECKNIRITDNYKMQKRNGYTALFPTALATPIRGMWYGKIAGTYNFIFSCGGFVFAKRTLSSAIYDSYVTTNTHVDVIKTTAYASAVAGTTGVDGMTIVLNSVGTQRTEVTQANIDLVASVGKFYYHTDKTVWIIVAKSAYANIGAARTGLGSMIVYYRIGTCADARTTFFAFNDKVYLQDGTNYSSWDGSTNLATVAGYIPCIFIATPPTGGGTPYEDLNLLTGKKHQTFNGNNSATAFTIGETAVDSVDAVYVGGVLKTVTTHYTVNATTGVITFTGGNTPPTGTDNVDIYWTKGSGTRATVTAHNQSILFGGANDSRVFMWGDGNSVIFSALAAGVLSAEYFPPNNFLLVGSDEYDVTHINKQYDRIIIHKERDSYYATYDYDATLGASFPTYPLNDNIGNVAFGQGQNVLNNPFVVTPNGVFQFVATNVRDEKNAMLVSDRIQVGLEDLDLTTALTFDFENNLEYWLFVGSVGYVYNYKIDCWYYFELAHTPTCFMEIDGQAYFGTSTGKIMVFDTDDLTDDGTAISSRWETAFFSFDANYMNKFLNFAWVGMQPEGKSKCSISWESDNGASATDYDIEYNLNDFTNTDFSDFSFATNYTPKPFAIKFKIKKFTYMKLIGENTSSTQKQTILNITLPVTYGGRSK